MNKSFATRTNFQILTALLCAMGAAAPSHADITDLANSPLAEAPASTVAPNVMFILDNSGSTSSDNMPDNVNDPNSAKTYCTNSGNTGTAACSSNTANAAQRGDPPYYAGVFNGVYYDPQVTYLPGKNFDGSSKPSQLSPWTAVSTDGYLGGGTINLTTSFPERVYCNDSSASVTDTSKCKRNGITTNPFTYKLPGASGDDSYPNNVVAGSFRYPKTLNGAPFYYDITPVEWCDSVSLTNCKSSVQTTFTIPAPVRFCKDVGAAGAAPGAAAANGSGGTPNCRAKYDKSSTPSYTFARYGTFTRTNIVPPTSTTYGNRDKRSDCAAAPNCSYAEEMTNFANWYAYYRKRLLTEKSAAGRAFVTLGSSYRVGFVTINPGSPVPVARYLPIAAFDATQKSAWFTKLYSQDTSGGTPLAEALSRVGRHYAGVTTGINAGMPEDPVQYSCQQNFAILTSDGYWDSSPAIKIDSTAIGNADNTLARPFFDGNIAGATNTLADVAAYYYKTDLRPTGPVSTNNVKGTPKDDQTQQHMTTFTVGVGADGLMTYRPDYETASGDYANVKAGTNNACSWVPPGGTCNWPLPASDQPTAIDDMWHAAVNGRGSYFSARDPVSLYNGLTTALATIQVQTASASASATSSPHITLTDNAIYSSTFRTSKWDGEVTSQKIDSTTGNVLAFVPGNPATGWVAQAQLDAKVSATSDTRVIYTFDPTASPSKLKLFQWANLTASEQAYFSSKCTTWSQCSAMGGGDQNKANNGQNVVEYLRGQFGFEQQAGNPTQLFRDREHVLGDPVNASPIFIRDPRFNFGDAVSPSYASYKSANSSRQPVLYLGANDGMLHALDANTGAELWAYVPKIVMPNMYKLAEQFYATNHVYYVDGTPSTMDVFFGGAWHTILVGGLNGGGRGYYALDVTDPANPKALWEICSDSTLCALSDSDIGFTFGDPVITKRASDGKWVVAVASGYNNVSPGTGRGFLFLLDVATGVIVEKIDTGVGDITTPSGLSKINGFANDFNTDNTTLRIYGGDLLGNVWRFDLTSLPTSKLSIAQLKDAGGKPQSITIKPELGEIQGYPVVFVGTGRYLGVKDLVDPATLIPPLPYAYQQSMYAIKDTATNYGNVRLSGMVQQTITQPTSTTRTTSNNAVDWATQRGWFLDFNPGNASPGERVNVDTQLVAGTLLVFTNVPKSDACSVGGDSWIYQLDYLKGTYVSNSPGQVAATKNLYNELVAGAVVVQLPSGALKIIITGTTGDKQTIGLITGSGTVSSRRVSWRELIR